MNMKNLKNRKGFTLVEVIVVLVILAILAALLIPALTGYIDEANERAVSAECRSAVMAAQTLSSEFYAGVGDDFDADDVKTLSEVPGDVTFDYDADGATPNNVYVNADGKVIKLIYVSENGARTCTYAYKDGKGAYTMS